MGTDAAIGLANALTRFGTFYSMGLLDRHLIQLGMFMGLVTFHGSWVASRLVHRMGNRIHNQLIEAVIAIAGAVFIFRALDRLGVLAGGS